MKIVVAFKWARDPEDAAVRVDGSVDWRGAKMVAGEDDPAAVAVGLAVALASGSELVGLTIGDGDASWAVARGIEHVVAVSDVAALADNAATAGLLAAAIRWIGEVDVVVIGNAEANPGVPAVLAGDLGWPAVLGASDATIADGRLLVTRRVAENEETLSLGLPAVIAVVAASAEKHVPGMKEVLAARRRPITIVPLEDLKLDAIDRLESRGTRLPEVGSAHVFDGSPASAAQQLVAALRNDGVL